MVFKYLPFLAFLISLVNVVFALRNLRTRGAWFFLVLALATAWYSLAHGIELRQEDLSGLLFWDRLQFFPVDVLPVVALGLALELCYPEGRARWISALLVILPLVNVPLVWWGPPDLYYLDPRLMDVSGVRFLAYDYGWWMWVTIGYSYALLLVAMILLLYRLAFAGRLPRRQLGLVLAGFTIPFGGTLLTVSGAVPFELPGLDLTPITFSCANILFAIALFRYGLLRLMPIARERVFAEMADGVLVLAGDGLLVDWNPAAERMLSPFTRRTLAPGQALADIIPELVGRRTGVLELNAPATRTTLFLRMTSIADGRAGHRGRILTLQDISELQAAREQLEAEKARAEFASSAKSRLLASASHEIRTPINAILGVADLLEETDLDPKQRELLDVLGTASRTFLHVLNDMLDLSRIEAGRVDLQPEDFDLSVLLSELGQTFRLYADERKLTLDIDVEQGVPERIHADPKRLSQVIANLLSNAFKHTERGRVTLAVATAGEDLSRKGRSRLAFTVTDTGHGIPEDFLPRLFEPFMQDDSRDSGPVEGAGLGLSIARQFVELMGGEITAGNAPGGGARFRFTIQYDHPARNTTADPPAEAASRGGVGSSIGPGVDPTAWAALKGLRVLVAEDNRDNQMLIERYLESTGVDLRLVQNGNEAVAAFENEKFDAVFLDIQMPGLDGYEAARRMRAVEHETARSPVPIIALTAYALEEERSRALMSGMNDHMTKPIKRTVLIEKIYELSQSPSAVEGQP